MRIEANPVAGREGQEVGGGVGRGSVEKQVGRRVVAGALRYALRQALAHPGMFAPLLKLGRGVRPLLPGSLKDSIPPPLQRMNKMQSAETWPSARHISRMLLHNGCVQPALAPTIKVATAQRLEKPGLTLNNAGQAGRVGGV